MERAEQPPPRLWSSGVNQQPACHMWRQQQQQQQQRGTRKQHGSCRSCKVSVAHSFYI